MIITIDGPAISGKSTIAKMLAEQLGYKYLSTGIIYRTIAFAAVQEGTLIDEICRDELLDICNNLCYDLDMCFISGELLIFYHEISITNLLRMKEIDNKSSIVSSFPFIREAILDYQRGYAKNNNIVVEGRDTGSVVFPNADIKFYLTSSIEERARRENKTRPDELYENIHIVKEQIFERDKRDMNREIAPLVIPNNAIKIDNTDLTIDETFALFLHCIYKETEYDE